MFVKQWNRSCDSLDQCQLFPWINACGLTMYEHWSDLEFVFENSKKYRICSDSALASGASTKLPVYNFQQKWDRTWIWNLTNEPWLPWFGEFTASWVIFSLNPCFGLKVCMGKFRFLEWLWNLMMKHVFVSLWQLASWVTVSNLGFSRVLLLMLWLWPAGDFSLSNWELESWVASGSDAGGSRCGFGKVWFPEQLWETTHRQITKEQIPGSAATPAGPLIVKIKKQNKVSVQKKLLHLTSTVFQRCGKSRALVHNQWLQV